MPALGSITLINAPLEAVFDLAQDNSLRLKWDPFIKDVKFVRGNCVEPGARVWLRDRSGVTMTLEFFGVKRPLVLATKMVRGPLVFRQLVANWQFRSVDADTTEVSFKCVFETRWYWLGWLIDPVVYSLTSRDNRRRLAGLRRGAEEMGLIGQSGTGGP